MLKENKNFQAAPWPTELEDLVGRLTYKSNWTFSLRAYDRGQGSEGLTLTITILTPNSYNPDEMRRVAHLFPVPPAAYDRRSWQRWLFDQIVLVERHEAMEFFTIGAIKPYAPSHGPGNDPYMLREIGTMDDVITSFRGEKNGN